MSGICRPGLCLQSWPKLLTMSEPWPKPQQPCMPLTLALAALAWFAPASRSPQAASQLKAEMRRSADPTCSRYCGPLPANFTTAHLSRTAETKEKTSKRMMHVGKPEASLSRKTLRDPNSGRSAWGFPRLLCSGGSRSNRMTPPDSLPFATRLVSRCLTWSCFLVLHSSLIGGCMQLYHGSKLLKAPDE